MLVFTEGGLGADRETVYTVGWSMDVVLVIHFVLNVCIIAYQFSQAAFSMIKRFIKIQKMKALKAKRDATELSLK